MDIFSDISPINTSPVLDVIIRTVVQSLSPEKIFLFGKRENIDGNKGSHFYLLILLQEIQADGKDLHSQLVNDSVPCPSFTFFVRKTATAYDSYKRGDIWYTPVLAEPTNLVYDSRPDLPLPVPEPLPIADIQSIAESRFSAIYKKAEAFYRGAEFYATSHENEMVAFMLQQAIEHSFRSVLQPLMDYEMSGHNIRRAWYLVQSFSPDFTPIFPNNSEEEKALFSLPVKAYSKARYLLNYEVNPGDIDQLLQRVERLLFKVKKIFRDYVDAFPEIQF